MARDFDRQVAEFTVRVAVLDGFTARRQFLIAWEDRDAFAARFRRHAGKRPKRRGLLRNAAVALGNSGDPAAVSRRAI